MANSITIPESATTSAGRRDGVSPTPWSFDIVPSGFALLYDVDNFVVSAGIRAANAKLIVEAVNSHDALQGQAFTLDAELAGARHTCDKLRALVRRLTRSLEDATDVIKQRMTTLSITLPDSSRTMLHGVDIDALLDEAREAIDGIRPGAIDGDPNLIARLATKQEIDDGKAVWCEACRREDCLQHGHDTLAVCRAFLPLPPTTQPESKP